MSAGDSAGQQTQRKQARAERLRREAADKLRQAEFIERQAQMWARGRAGEQTVGAQLELLRDRGYIVVHDLHWPGRPRANIDHIAIGAGGIIVVDAKNWAGKVTVKDGVLRQSRFRRAREVEGARQAARDVAAELKLEWALHAIPVIALAGSATPGVQQCGDVVVVGHQDLVAWASNLPARLSTDEVRSIGQYLSHILRPATGPGAPVPTPTLPAPTGHVPTQTSYPPGSPSRVSAPTAYRPARRSPSRRGQRREAKRKAVRREALVKLGLVLVLLLALPSLLGWWSRHGSDVIASAIPDSTTTSTSVPGDVGAPQAFTSCRDLRQTYPAGVRRHHAKNKGPIIRRGVVVNAAAYRLNIRLDRDHDGIACEIRRHN